MKIFELAQINLFSPEVKNGGASHWRFIAMYWQALGLGGMEFAGSTWTWTPTWMALMEMGGFDPAAANRGAYAGLVHGIPSRPKSKPKPAATPATRPPPAAAPPQPPGYLRQGPGAISPALDRHGTVC